MCVSGVGPEGGNLSGKAAIQEVKTQPGDQQRADAEIRSRKPLQVSKQDFVVATVAVDLVITIFVVVVLPGSSIQTSDI